jgi:hypothetical protein
MQAGRGPLGQKTRCLTLLLAAFKNHVVRLSDTMLEQLHCFNVICG